MLSLFLAQPQSLEDEKSAQPLRVVVVIEKSATTKASDLKSFNIRGPVSYRDNRLRF